MEFIFLMGIFAIMIFYCLMFYFYTNTISQLCDVIKDNTTAVYALLDREKKRNGQQ